MGDLVSVILPVYNGRKYLHRCIASIINQSHREIEIWIVNDGSTDNSGEICDAYARGDHRIRVIHTPNKGPGSARNTGIGHCAGSFIFFIDADDFIQKNALELLLEGCREHKADLVVGDFIKVKDGDGNGRPGNAFANDTLLSRQDIIDYVRRYLKKPNRHSLFAYSWGRLFKSAVIKNNNIFFDPCARTFEDVGFNFGYLRHSNEIFFLKKNIYTHLVHENYLSAGMAMAGNPQNLFGYRRAFGNIRAFLQDCNLAVDMEGEVGHAYISYTIIQLVRVCGQINTQNRKKIYGLVYDIIREPNVRGNLRYYSPSKGDSRILPVLIKLRLIWPIIFVCKYKAVKRYGNH